MGKIAILLLFLNTMQIQCRTALKTKDVFETYNQLTIKGKGSYEKCPEGNECEYPFKCAYQGGKDKNVCLREKCSSDSDCNYPLRCLFADTGEGDVCSLKSCEGPDDCEYPFECINFGGKTGKMCKRLKCSQDYECTYPLKCVDLRKTGEGQVCAHENCTKDDDCSNPLKCIDNSREGQVCKRKPCNNDGDCPNDLKCEDLGGLKGKVCSECDCGVNGLCSFLGKEKKCVCAPFTYEVNGKCIGTETTTSSTMNRILTSTVSRTETTISSTMTGILTSTVSLCHCGPATKSCYLDSYGDKHCTCIPEYISAVGYCTAICSESKCIHGKCEILGNDFKCRCDEGFTGNRCEDSIQSKYDKQDLWIILQVALMFAIFILLSIMLCFLVNIKRKH